MKSGDSINLIILGETGTGKSSLGNNILRREAFESRPSAGRVTRSFQKETSYVHRRKLVVVDTPDFTSGVSLERENGTILPNPHVFLFVTSVGDDPFSLTQSLEMFKTQLGEDVLQYTLIVFTREHDLRREQEETSGEEYIQHLPETLQNLIACCRHVFLDNNASCEEREDKIQELLLEVDGMRGRNIPSTFSYRTHKYSLRQSSNGVY